MFLGLGRYQKGRSTTRQAPYFASLATPRLDVSYHIRSRVILVRSRGYHMFAVVQLSDEGCRTDIPIESPVISTPRLDCSTRLALSGCNGLLGCAPFVSRSTTHGTVIDLMFSRACCGNERPRKLHPSRLPKSPSASKGREAADLPVSSARSLWCGVLPIRFASPPH